MAQLDGGESEDELRDVCLQISKMHGRQRHNDNSIFQTSFSSYQQTSNPIADPLERPERMN